LLRAAPGTPAEGYWTCVGGQSTGVIECVPQQHFNVRIGAPQLVRCPTGKRIMNSRIDAQEKVLPFGHGLRFRFLWLEAAR
jgi:hypothetical protein